jgi:hypothetical protein
LHILGDFMQISHVWTPNDQTRWEITPNNLYCCESQIKANTAVRNAKQSKQSWENHLGILKYHQTSLISYERSWPLACLDGLIKPNPV